jgi:NADP-dependent 3-hydroxy acid dehydrogenase YdfG
MALTNSLALVTGATSDLGAAIACGLADASMTVLATGRDQRKLKNIVSSCEERIVMVPADLTRPADMDGIQGIVTRYGRLDVLVLGSGIYERSTNPEKLMLQFLANVHGPYSLLQLVLPQLVASEGLVVFINSTQGLTASPGVGQFAATQHAMRAIADSTRGEVNSLGVRVTSIFLGRTATARQAAIFASEQRDYVPERLIQPRDVANVVATLASLPRTSEVTEITMRPRLPPLPSK